MNESKLKMEDKSVVTPGDVVAEGMEFLPGSGTYRHEDHVLANRTGVLNVDGKVLKIMPLASVYMPVENDVVVGKVVDILMSGWRVNVNCPYVSVLPLQEASFDFIRKGADLTEYFDIGDYVLCKIVRVTSQNLVDISMKSPGLRKLKGGNFVYVNPAKIPRIIGRKGSMVGMIKHATGCDIVVGQNGIVWISGEPDKEVLAITAVKRIDEQAHIPGLTDKIKAFLEKETGQEIDMTKIPQEAPVGERPHRSGPPNRGPPNRGPPRNGPPNRGNKGRFRRPREESFKRGE